VPIGIFTGGAVINSNLAGGDLVMIASSMNVMTFAVMARPEFRSVEDLKGKKIGIFTLRLSHRLWLALC
jgi:ABC-type nitrate/sulfonate/bicarbonate transport system substrate-binding protein